MPEPKQPRTPHRDADGIVEVRTGRRSPVMLLSGAVLAASLAGTAWLALHALEPALSPRPVGGRETLEPPSAAQAIAAASLAAVSTPSARRPARATPPRAGPAAEAAPPATEPTTLAEPPLAGGGTGDDPAGSAPSGAEPPGQPSGGDPGDGPTGIAAFPPLGTKPILRGIVVPDGFELPPGYVRHYQATDDGRMLPPVLRFHPDHPPLDASGKPLPVTPGGLVPPEWAPPGLPIEYLDVPETSR